MFSCLLRSDSASSFPSQLKQSDRTPCALGTDDNVLPDLESTSRNPFQSFFDRRFQSTLYPTASRDPAGDTAENADKLTAGFEQTTLEGDVGLSQT